MMLIEESSLNESIIFQTFNRNSEMMNTINLCIKNGLVLDPSYIQEQLIQMKRTRISPLVDKVMDAYEKEDILIIFSKTTRVPKALPFVILKVQGKLRAFIFVNNYGKISENKNGTEQYLNMPMKDLYVLMEGAFIGLTYYKYPVQLTKNLGLMKITNQIYTEMFLRILNKEYALSLNQDVYEAASFCISKFYLKRVWESKNDDINTSYAMGTILNPDKTNLTIVNDTYDEKDPKNFAELIALLVTLSPRLGKLNLRYFTQCWINTYKATAIFGMETLPYFLFIIEATMIGSFVINQPIISTIIKNIRSMNLFYPELSKVF